MRQSSADSTGPEMEYCGKLHFALRYDKDVEGLVVKVYSTTLIELPISSWGDINLIHNYMLVPFKEGSLLLIAFIIIWIANKYLIYEENIRSQ